MKLMALMLMALTSIGAMSCQNPAQTDQPSPTFEIGLFDGKDSCGAKDAAAQLGENPDYLTELQAQAEAGGDVRIIHPNTAVTMDARPERLNVTLNENGEVISLSCI